MVIKAEILPQVNFSFVDLNTSTGMPHVEVIFHKTWATDHSDILLMYYNSAIKGLVVYLLWEIPSSYGKLVFGFTFMIGKVLSKHKPLWYLLPYCIPSKSSELAPDPSTNITEIHIRAYISRELLLSSMPPWPPRCLAWCPGCPDV